VLTFLGAILLFVLTQWRNLTGFEFEAMSAEQISMGHGLYQRSNSAWSPLAWVARPGRRGSGSLALGGVLSRPDGSRIRRGVLACVGGFRAFVLHGLASLQVGTQRKEIRRGAERRGMSGVSAGFFRRLLPPEVRAILVKDLKELRRDLRNLSQVIGPLIMGIVFAVMLLRTGGEPPRAKARLHTVMDLSRSALAYGSMVIALFVGWGCLPAWP